MANTDNVINTSNIDNTAVVEKTSKYKVLRVFYDKNTGEIYAAGKTVSFTDDRAAEIKSREPIIGYQLIEEVKSKKEGK